MTIGKKHNSTGWAAPLFGLRLQNAIVAGTFLLPGSLFLKIQFYICAGLNVLNTFKYRFPSDCRKNPNCHEEFIKTTEAYHRMLRL
jgi:hypothetical protein